MAKVFVACTCVHMVARNKLNGTVQFNGYFGCDWRVQKGRYIARSMRYEYIGHLEERTHERMLKHAEEAEETGEPKFGVKSRSALSLLWFFNLITHIACDSLHFYGLGVTKQITEYLIKLMTKEELGRIDEMLLKNSSAKADI